MFTPPTTDKDVQDRLNAACNIYQLPSVLDPAQAVLESSVSLDTYLKSIFPSNIYSDDAMSERTTASQQQSTLVCGQSIKNNSGIPLTAINKIPSYQWSFKHEEDHSGKSHHSHSHSHYHKKHILSGLGTGNESISLLGGTSMNSTALNSLLIRLPVKSDSSKKRSMLNGLPYYDKNIIDKQIRVLNIEKAKMKLPVTNSSVFTESFNESVDDVEYLHGEVILNQFLTNKRAMRDYQWLLYYIDRYGGRSLTEGVKYDSTKIVSVRTVKQFQKWLQKRQEKLSKVRTVRAQITERREQRDRKRKEKLRKQEDGNIGEFFSTESDPTDNLSEEEDKDKALEATLPPFEDEVEISEDEDPEPDHDSAAWKGRRFPPPGQVKLEDRELIIEKEFAVDDPELLQFQRSMYGIAAASQMEQEVAESNGLLQTKRVRLRRLPNPNALGYSNIRRRGPSYLN